MCRPQGEQPGPRDSKSYVFKKQKARVAGVCGQGEPGRSWGQEDWQDSNTIMCPRLR